MRGLLERLARCWRRSYGTLNDGPGSVSVQLELSVVRSQVAALARAAFKDLAPALERIEKAEYLPSNEAKAVVLCYLCAVHYNTRMPFTRMQYEGFCDYVYKRYAAYTWLGWRRAAPSFFFPVLFPVITTFLFFYCDSLTAADDVVIGLVFSIIGTVGGQTAGWVITGTNPNVSSEAANHAQNMLLDVTDDYEALAYYLLDLYLSDVPAMRAFASKVAAALDTDLLERIMVSLVPRPDPNEPEDPTLSRARFRRILTPLRDVTAYIRSEGCQPPLHEGLRGRVEVAHLREQVGALAARLDLVASHVSVALHTAGIRRI